MIDNNAIHIYYIAIVYASLSVAVLKKGVKIMVFYNQLQPRYARQKSFYNKAYYIQHIDNNINTYELLTDNINKGFQKVAKIVIDKKHLSKSRYYITSDKKLFDKLTYKHICDFIFQFYNHPSTLKKITRRNKFVKNKLLQYALELN